MEKVNEVTGDGEAVKEKVENVTKCVREIRVNYRGPKKRQIVIKEPADAAQFIRDVLPDNSREHFVALYLDGAHQVIGFSLISTGTANSCQVHPREIYQRAVLLGSVALVVGHNHPSGQLIPSEEDRRVTKALKSAGEVIGINLLDHVIVNDTGLYSFKDTGGV
jgi:DNA repair protein RadC